MTPRRGIPFVSRRILPLIAWGVIGAACESPMSPESPPVADVGGPSAKLLELQSRLGTNVPGMNVTVVARLSPATSARMSLAPSGIWADEAPGTYDTGEAAPYWDVLTSHIFGNADVNYTEYYVGGYMRENKGATVSVGALGYVSGPGITNLRLIKEYKEGINRKEIYDQWPNTCADGERNSIGGTGTVAARQVVIDNYLPPAAYKWGPVLRSLFSECNPKPRASCTSQLIYDPAEDEACQPTGGTGSSWDDGEGNTVIENPPDGDLGVSIGDGSSSASANCEVVYVTIEISYDGGATWYTWWKGNATVCSGAGP